MDLKDTIVNLDFTNTHDKFRIVFRNDDNEKCRSLYSSILECDENIFSDILDMIRFIFKNLGFFNYEDLLDIYGSRNPLNVKGFYIRNEIPKKEIIETMHEEYIARNMIPEHLSELVVCLTDAGYALLTLNLIL